MHEQILPTMRTVTRASLREISMRVGLFIPRYMDAFEPEVGIATLELLERLGCTGALQAQRAPTFGGYVERYL